MNNVQADYSATYSVVVGNGTCTTESFGALTVVSQPPTITYTLAGDTVTLNWTGTGFTLQEATALTGSPGDWSDISGASSGHQVNTSTGTKFFRLKQ